MEQPNRLFIIFRHHDDGLDSLQRMDHIPTFSLENSSEVVTVRSRSEDLHIEEVKARMTLQSSSKLSVREVASVIDEIDKCERKNKRPRRFLNECMKIRLRRPW